MSSKLTIRPWGLSLAAAAFIVAANNQRLFSELVSLLDTTSIEGLGFLMIIVLLMIVVLNAILLILGIGPALKVVVATAFIMSATLGYFSNEMGVIFDQEMFSNIADTIRERNVSEASELMSGSLIQHVFLFGVVPSLLLVFVRLRPCRPLIEFRDRVVVMFVGVVIVGIIGISDYRYVTYFAVEHRDLRFTITPIFPIISLVKNMQDSFVDDPKFVNIATDAIQHKAGQKRTVGIMVVGETARSDRFSLNGYGKLTNPVLENEKGLFFFDAKSCGTSTAYAVPCMFFLRGRENYSPTIARAESNVLDVLTAAGIKTAWIDNNSTCKHVCDRIENTNLRIRPDGSANFDGGYDIDLVQAVEHYLTEDGPDLLIVLHTMGSHGPAYSQRYPLEFAVFSPFCERLSPVECDLKEVGNAYDNSIAYTDYILGELIVRLKEHSNDYDSFLFYASDHGESLGENGVYLHGLPYMVAPSSQTDVPIIVWLSPEYTVDTGVNVESALANSSHNLSHDDISHTLLGMYGVKSEWYRPEHDIFMPRTPDVL